MTICGTRVGIAMCIACGAEMRLMQAVPDNTMMVSGYEHHTLQCTGCDEVERRLVFTREKKPAAMCRSSQSVRLRQAPPKLASGWRPQCSGRGRSQCCVRRQELATGE